VSPPPQDGAKDGAKDGAEQAAPEGRGPAQTRDTPVEVGRRRREATVHDLPLLERRRIEATVLVPVVRALQARFGEAEVNEVVGEAIRGLARAQGREAAEHHPTDTIADLRARVAFASPAAEGALEIVEVSGDEGHWGFDVERCAFVAMYAELGAADLGHLLSCGRDDEWYAAMAPGLRFERTETLMEGGPRCDFRFRGSPGT
jgi:hypothetical protein